MILVPGSIAECDETFYSFFVFICCYFSYFEDLGVSYRKLSLNDMKKTTKSMMIPCFTKHSGR